MSTVSLYPGAGTIDDIAALTIEQQAEARLLALASPAKAEAHLQMILRRWNSRVIGRYVAEVLLNGADHLAWTAANAHIPSWDEENASRLGRDLTAEECEIVDDIRDVGGAHRAVCQQLCVQHGSVTGMKYLRGVTRFHTLGMLADFIEYVIRGTMSHDDWVARRRPMF